MISYSSFIFVIIMNGQQNMTFWTWIYTWHLTLDVISYLYYDEIWILKLSRNLLWYLQWMRNNILDFLLDSWLNLIEFDLIFIAEFIFFSKINIKCELIILYDNLKHFFVSNLIQLCNQRYLPKYFLIHPANIEFMPLEISSIAKLLW